MAILTLIRHGETAWNAEGRFQGQMNTPLNDTGRRQAHIIAHALADRHFDLIYTSDLARAAETAAIVAHPHGLVPIPDTRLREAYFGEWEGLSLPEITARWPEIVSAWRADSLHTRPPGGETLEQVQARVIDFLHATVREHPEDDICIVGHGGSLRAIIAYALGADLSIFRRLRLDNCSLTKIKVTDHNFSLVQFNDICHLNTQAPRGTWDEAGDQWRLAFTEEPPAESP
jgi:alpha-ribazole phosphatase/probable phosphoglycerate mutase